MMQAEASPERSVGAAKACTHCGIVKPLGEYYVRYGQGDGYQSECKACHRRYVAEYNRTHRVQVQARKRQSDAQGMGNHRDAGSLMSMDCPARYLVRCPACHYQASMEFEVTRSGFLRPIPDRKFRMEEYGSRSLLVHVGCETACVIHGNTREEAMV